MGGLEVIILLLLLVFLGIPIVFALGLSSSIYIILNGISPVVITQRMNSLLQSFPLLAVPLFIFAGNIMNVSGLTGHIFDFAKLFVGKVRGALGHVNILASLIFSGISGAALADIGGLGTIEIEAMNAQGYDPKDSACVTVASSTIGPIFPPSIPMVIYATTAQVSGVKMLAAGIVPGLLITLLLMVLVAFIAHRKDWPRETAVLTKKERVKKILVATPAVLSPVILLAGLFSGYFSPTEIASVCVFYSLFLSFVVYKTLTFKDLMKVALDSVKTTASILIVSSAAALFAWVLTVEQFPQFISGMFLSISNNPYILLIMLNVILLIAGMFINTTAAILIFVPIFLPLFNSLGLSPIHLGTIMVLNLMVGLLTPPVGMSLYLTSQISKVPVDDLLKSLAPYMATLLLALLLVTFIPQLSTWLPSLI